jgi:hypothetical protein
MRYRRLKSPQREAYSMAGVRIPIMWGLPALDRGIKSRVVPEGGSKRARQHVKPRAISLSSIYSLTSSSECVFGQSLLFKFAS